jgi:purine catabolism regulator
VDLESLLAALGPPERLQAFYEARLGALRDYDHAHSAQLVETLDAYFAAGRSLAGTAQLLNKHRNTVLYRLRLIEEVAGVDLRDPQTALDLQVALRIAAALAR